MVVNLSVLKMKHYNQVLRLAVYINYYLKLNSYNYSSYDFTADLKRFCKF